MCIPFISISSFPFIDQEKGFENIYAYLIQNLRFDVELVMYSERIDESTDMGLNAGMNAAASETATAEKAPDFNALLVAVGKSQDRSAFIQLFEHFAPRVKSFLMKNNMNPETADELAQETMLAVWDKAQMYNPSKAKASTWIYTIARNKRIDFIRKDSRDMSVDYDPIWVEDDAPSPRQNVIEQDEQEKLKTALEDLPSDQSELIYKSFFEGKSHAQISEETGIALGTVKSRIRAALMKLRADETVEALQ